MPFLDRVSRWAEEHPQELAVVCGGEQLSWRELHAEAAALAASGKATGILRQPNGVDVAVRWAAGVAEERECAVLDPSWPAELAEQVQRYCAARVPTAPAPAQLRDGDPASAFLIGLTSGTTALPKAFSRSRGSWPRSFEASIGCFGPGPEDHVMAPGPLSAGLNLYALSECLYAGATFSTLARFDVAAAHGQITARGITRLVVVPTMLRVLAERGLTAGVGAGGVTAIVCAGQKLDPTTLEADRHGAPTRRSGSTTAPPSSASSPPAHTGSRVSARMPTPCAATGGLSTRRTRGRSTASSWPCRDRVGTWPPTTAPGGHWTQRCGPASRPSSPTAGR